MLLTQNETENIKYLPKVMISPKKTAEKKIVMIKDNGVDMERKTGPFFSITHVCK